MNHEGNRKSINLKDVIFILSVACVTIGSSIGIQLPFFVLSPYRLFLIVSIIVSAYVGRFYCSKHASRIMLYWTLLIIYAAVSYVWVADISEWKNSMIYLVIGFFILFTWITCRSTFDIMNKIRTVFALWLSVVIIIGWYEVLTGHYLFLKNQNIMHKVSYIQNRVPIVFFTNTNNFCLYISFCYLFLTPVWLGTNRLGKMYYTTMLLGGIPLIFISKSRANILGLAIGFLAWWIIINYGNISKKRLLSTLLIVFTVIIVGVIYFDRIWDTIVRYIFFSGASTFLDSRSNMGRVNLIRNGIHMIEHSLGFGVGAGSSRASCYHIYDTHGIVDLHNWWLLLFSEYGVLFGLAYIMIYVKQVKEMLVYMKSEYDKHSDTYLTLASFAAVDIAFIVGLISPSSVLGFEWLWVYWGIKTSWINCYVLKKNEVNYV